MIDAFQGKTPKIDKTAHIDRTARVIGDVEIGENSSIWCNAVLRGDIEGIRIGKNTSIQDNCVVHTSPGKGVEIGDNVTIAHNVIVHACKIGMDCIIGMGAIILTGVEVGDDCIVAAGSVVKENEKIPPRSLVAGIPAKIKRQLTDKDIKRIRENALHYVELAGKYKA